MSEIIDVQLGQSLPPERWHLAGERLAPIFNDMIGSIDRLSPEEREMMTPFKEDLQLALGAIGYVATFASENCRFVNVEGLPRRGEDRK